MRIRGWLRFRVSSSRLLLVSIFAAMVIIYCYYYTSTGPSIARNSVGTEDAGSLNGWLDVAPSIFRSRAARKFESPPTCSALRQSHASVDTVPLYSSFDFQPVWIRTKEYWDESFERRYENLKNDTTRPKLKVFVVPHSHNDPGWLRTFENYYEEKTKSIIDNMITKLQQYRNMTFMWTEMSFLSAWWETSHPTKQKILKRLIKEGRIEITTGGWVMTDEANTHVYAIIDQLMEGHTWAKNTLGVTPKTGWSIDPFGHGPTVPYLLEQSGFEGAIIQRIHYAWKRWFAERQAEDFHWIAGWQTDKKPSLVVHNQPFDIYSIKASCGPHPAVCLSFDFRMIPGEYTEYSAKHEEITDQNLHSKSKLLMEEYSRISSLTVHNVILVPLGDDFRYEHAIEFDAQYGNYNKMFNYINGHQEMFHAEVMFGTPLDYFKALAERQQTLPTLKGDFFVYSDIFSEGKAAYWSGYYTTRPYLKILTRQLEHHLRSAEILFTLVFNHIKQNKPLSVISQFRGVKRMEKYYEQIIKARRNLGLFQHHDAITGTSKANVMADYGAKLFTSIYNCIRLQETALSVLMVPDPVKNTLQSEVEWETYGGLPEKLKISVVDRKKIVLFNPLNEERVEIVTVRTNTSNVRVYDNARKVYVLHQVNPNMDAKPDGHHIIRDNSFDVLFVASLPPLAAVTYTIEEHSNPVQSQTIIYCNSCNQTEKKYVSRRFTIRNMMPGDIQLENSVMKLLINRQTGFLKHVIRKDTNKKHVMEMRFGAYQSAQRHSGAYLFMPDYDTPEKDVLSQYSNYDNSQDENIVIVSGKIATEITTLYLPFLVHTLRIFNVKHPHLSEAIFVENIVNFETPPKNRETELFMRLQTSVQNGDVPEFYTDQNGFQYQKRVKVPNLGVEANYYPITTMVWMQDDETRVTLVTDHAQGATSYQPGQLEVMLDRRMLYDDFRGMGEGVVDNKQVILQHWLTLEYMNSGDAAKSSERHFNKKVDTTYQVPSRRVNYLSRTINYPVHVYLLEEGEQDDSNLHAEKKLVQNFPADLHVMTLRTITDEALEQFPSTACYMIVHRPASACSVVGPPAPELPNVFTDKSAFVGVKIKNITAVSLTGLHEYERLDALSEINVVPMEVKTFKIHF